MQLIRRFRLTPATAIALAALIVALGGAAFAAIPDSDGTVHTCYQSQNGNLRVVESAQECRSGERPLALSAARQSTGGSQIVARARSTGPVPVTAPDVTIPLTGNTWTQAANETNDIFFEATITIPPADGCATSQVNFFVDGERLAVALYGGGGNSGTVVRRLSSFLLDPGAPTPREVTATVTTFGLGTTCGAVIDSVRINVAAID
jgi:hypothetical protein